MNQIQYILRRLVLAVPTFIGITLVCFALTRFLPGGPVEMRLIRMRGGDRQSAHIPERALKGQTPKVPRDLNGSSMSPRRG